jgi:hypothetical protein
MYLSGKDKKQTREYILRQQKRKTYSDRVFVKLKINHWIGEQSIQNERSQGSAWAKNLEDREDYDPQLVGIKASMSLVKWKTISSYLLEIWGQPKAN